MNASSGTHHLARGWSAVCKLGVAIDGQRNNNAPALKEVGSVRVREVPAGIATYIDVDFRVGSDHRLVNESRYVEPVLIHEVIDQLGLVGVEEISRLVAGHFRYHL